MSVGVVLSVCYQSVELCRALCMASAVAPPGSLTRSSEGLHAASATPSSREGDCRPAPFAPCCALLLICPRPCRHSSCDPREHVQDSSEHQTPLVDTDMIPTHMAFREAFRTMTALAQPGSKHPSIHLIDPTTPSSRSLSRRLRPLICESDSHHHDSF
jgi:hypothetical protein